MTTKDDRRPLRVCYFGTYRAQYSRNQILLEGLRRNGVEVFECHEILWHSIEDRVQTVSGGWLRPGFWWRALCAYGRLIWRYGQMPDHDVVMVGYPGQLDVFPARLLSWLRRKPLVWDIFMSIYLIAVERGLEQRSRLSLRLLRFLEWAACRAPDRLILDTPQYVAWFGSVHQVPPERFRLVSTGADDRIYKPVPVALAADGVFRVIYYGTFIPNHGVRYIVEAARLLADEPAIHFELVGQGPDRDKVVSLVKQLGLENVAFVEWLDPGELVQHVARADICLGAFGTTPQSLMTVQNKIYEGLAMAKPVITGDSAAVRQVLKHGEQIYLCKRSDPESLAESVRYLHKHPEVRSALSTAGRDYFLTHFTIFHIGQQALRVLAAFGFRPSQG